MIDNPPLTHLQRGNRLSGDVPQAAIRSYLEKVMSNLEFNQPSDIRLRRPNAIAARIFRILTSRQFCYLSRTKTTPYRERVIALLRKRIRENRPCLFYFDIGPGYHASINPGRTGLVFHVGLAELLIVTQIVAFSKKVVSQYPKGGRFYLVIDNICALMTNDIPLERTIAYSTKLRELISELDLEHIVEVIVESEQFSLSEYSIDNAVVAKQASNLKCSRKEIENVQRFLGRLCDESEAARRIVRYKYAGALTEAHLEGIVRGIRMTQRATRRTLGFRAFPGADSRTQCGEVVLGKNSNGQLRPFLLTTRNTANFKCSRLEYPDLLPAMITHVTFAEPI